MHLRNLFISIILTFILLGIASAEVTDNFSDTLDKWDDKGNGEWSIIDEKLYVNYSIVCGSSGCPQADLILKEEFQIDDNYEASIDIIRTQDASHSDYFQAYGGFSIWKDSSNKIKIEIGGGGWDSWGGIQNEVRVYIQIWDGSWSSVLNEQVTYRWDPDAWNTISLKKEGATYLLYMNGTYLISYEDEFLNGSGKIGLHSYGTRYLDNFVLSSSSTDEKPQISVMGGFIKLDIINEGPSNADCSNEQHYGRMVFDDSFTTIYVCSSSGWIAK